MINCENCKHCNALSALGYGFCIQHNIPRKLSDFCPDFEDRGTCKRCKYFDEKWYCRLHMQAVGPSDTCEKLEENTGEAFTIIRNNEFTIAFLATMRDESANEILRKFAEGETQVEVPISIDSYLERLTQIFNKSFN